MDTLAPLTLLARTLAGLPQAPPVTCADNCPIVTSMLGTCPYGHQIGPGRVLVGWSPCNCAPALKNHRGHRTYQCLACLDHRITSVCYVPEHLGGGHPNR